eukprot:1012720-Amphidinium_carterae.1
MAPRVSDVCRALWVVLAVECCRCVQRAAVGQVLHHWVLQSDDLVEVTMTLNWSAGSLLARRMLARAVAAGLACMVLAFCIAPVWALAHFVIDRIRHDRRLVLRISGLLLIVGAICSVGVPWCMLQLALVGDRLADASCACELVCASAIQ